MYLGVDPGVSGGIAVVGENAEVVSLGKMPHCPRAIWEYFSGLPYVDAAGGTLYRYVVGIEKVGGWTGGRKGYGGNQAPGSRMFKFGENRGLCFMAALVALDVDPIEIDPKRWQHHFGMKKAKGETPTHFKGRLYWKARALYPTQRGLTLKTCDALLIARYLWETTRANP